MLQEVAVAKEILVMYGYKHISWKDLLQHSNLFLRLMAARKSSIVVVSSHDSWIETNNV